MKRVILFLKSWRNRILTLLVSYLLVSLIFSVFLPSCIPIKRISTTQSISNVEYIELVDGRSYPDEYVIEVLTGDKMTTFLKDFSRLRIGRDGYDPVEPISDWIVVLYYSDGTYERIGDTKSEFFSSTGELISDNEFYWIPDNKIIDLFEQYSS